MIRLKDMIEISHYTYYSVFENGKQVAVPKDTYKYVVTDFQVIGNELQMAIKKLDECEIFRLGEKNDNT